MLRSRLLATALTALLALGAAACDTGTSAEGGGTPPSGVGDDTGATGDGFDDLGGDATGGPLDEPAEADG
jgi:hypothetical protein